MSQEIENEELYVEHEEFGEGLVLSIDEDTDVAEIQFEHGIESIDINDLLEDLDDEESEEEDETEELEEGRGKKGAARHARDNDEDEFGYEKRGSKPAKGKFNYARQKKQPQYDESANLLGHALEKKPIDFTAAFNETLQARLEARIEALRVDMAQNMYNNSSEDGDEQDV